MTEAQLSDIRQHFSDCPIPHDAVADWRGTNHYEIHSPAGEYFWLDCMDFAMAERHGFQCASGERLGAVLDYACDYPKHVKLLLEEIDRLRNRERAKP